jgi:hypothetical protein
MMQFVTCNKSSLFAPRLKNYVNKEKTNIFVKQDKISNVLEVKDIHSFLYEIEA